MKKLALFGILAVAGVATSANAYEFRVRFVERVGNTDIVIPDNTLDISDGTARRIRIQFGVFDDADGAAPAGGFVGWNVGTVEISGDPGNSADRRTNGRLAPFNFATGMFSNGNPAPAGGPSMGDAEGTDFQGWTDIDATLGTQAPFWGCTPAPGEEPLPQPNATVRGLNTFVSVFELTTDPIDGAEAYSITFGGNLIAATEWRVVGNPLPPDCGDPDDPSDNVPGTIVYAPFPTAPVAFTATLNLVPAPGAAALLGLGGLVALRRRR